MEPWESLLLGAVGGLLYSGVSFLLVLLSLDDVVAASDVHGGNGSRGAIAVGFFCASDAGIGGNG
eukprot:287904-Prorocentrum_lima.AAC.1